MVVPQGKYNYSEVAMLDYKSMIDTFLRRVTLNYSLTRSTGGRKHPAAGRAVAPLRRAMRRTMRKTVRKTTIPL
jgi:hypothetical protein